MKLMTIDPETKLPVPTAECLTIPAFKELWTRRNRIDGDRDGAKKTRNLQEFGYVHFHGVWDSRFKFLDEKEKVDKIREILKLPEDWKADKVVDECIKIYVDAQHTPSLELYESTEGANLDLAAWIKSKRAAMKAGTAAAKEVSEILDIIERSPKVVENIQKTKELLQREQDALATGRKGRKLNKFETPH